MNNATVFKSIAGRNVIMALYDSILARWPVPYETGTVPTRHGDTFFISCGTKTLPPLILLHGAASNAVSWVGDAADYSKFFRVFAVDLPGEAGKSAEIRPSWQGLGFAEWLENVLNELKIDKAALVGISQGGWTALRFATVHPQRVSKLVLLAPGGVGPTRPSFIRKSIFYSLLGKKGVKGINRMVTGKQEIHPEAAKFMDAILTHFHARMEKEYVFKDEELIRLTMPTLLVGGSEDALIPIEKVIPRLERLLPQLKTVLIQGMGHALVNQSGLILPFLTS